MEQVYNRMKDYLGIHQENIVNRIINAVVNKEPEVFSNLLSETQTAVLKEQIRQYVELLGKHAAGQSSQEDIEQWGKRITEEKVKLGLNLNQSIQNFNTIREVTWDVLEEFTEGEVNLSGREFFRLGRFINDFVDIIILVFTKSFTSLTNQRLRSQQEVIDELSTPIISIVDGVAVLPIIGDIDTHRAKIIMEQALHESIRQEVECLIIDLSGVYIVDTMVAQELFKIIASLELTGVEVNITGVRPELAHSIVNLGINFGKVKMYNNLGQALKAFGIIRK